MRKFSLDSTYYEILNEFTVADYRSRYRVYAYPDPTNNTLYESNIVPQKRRGRTVQPGNCEPHMLAAAVLLGELSYSLPLLH